MLPHACNKLRQFLRRRNRLQIRDQLPAEHGVIFKRIFLSLLFHEEVEGIDNRHLRDQIHFDGEVFGRLRKDQPSQPIAVRVLLPIDEVPLRLNFERVAQNRRPAMRRRAKPDHLR